MVRASDIDQKFNQRETRIHTHILTHRHTRSTPGSTSRDRSGSQGCGAQDAAGGAAATTQPKTSAAHNRMGSIRSHAGCLPHAGVILSNTHTHTHTHTHTYTHIHTHTHTHTHTFIYTHFYIHTLMCANMYKHIHEHTHTRTHTHTQTCKDRSIPPIRKSRPNHQFNIGLLCCSIWWSGGDYPELQPPCGIICK